VILYCDTSALVKLYIVEPGSDAVKALGRQAESVAVCRIAWAEFHAALSRHAREVPADSARTELAKRRLADEWPRYVVVEVSQQIVEKAGEFADTFALRGYDAVQLAAAHVAMTEGRSPLLFACLDRRLNKAASVPDMEVPAIP
jgi:predicted nucleic acid-binding protein